MATSTLWAFCPDYTQAPMRSTLPPEVGSAHSIVRTPQTSSRGKRAPVVASGSIRTAIALAAAWEEGGAGARACSRRAPLPTLHQTVPDGEERSAGEERGRRGRAQRQPVRIGYHAPDGGPDHLPEGEGSREHAQA